MFVDSQRCRSVGGSSFDVTFALPGSLGIEFKELKAPYIVVTVHEGGVAFPLGIDSCNYDAPGCYHLLHVL